MSNQDSPEFIWPVEHRHCFIVPAKVLTAEATEGHAPAVTGKPGMGLGGYTMRKCSRAISEGVKVALYTGRVDKKMPAGSTYAKQSIRIGDKAATANTLVHFGTITTNSF